MERVRGVQIAIVSVILFGMSVSIVGQLKHKGDLQFIDIAAMFLHSTFLIIHLPVSGPCPTAFEAVHRQSLVTTIVE
jgi:hypothetical protein